MGELEGTADPRFQAYLGITHINETGLGPDPGFTSSGSACSTDLSSRVCLLNVGYDSDMLVATVRFLLEFSMKREKK